MAQNSRVHPLRKGSISHRKVHAPAPRMSRAPDSVVMVAAPIGRKVQSRKREGPGGTPGIEELPFRLVDHCRQEFCAVHTRLLLR